MIAENKEFTVSGTVEVWQNQRYWPFGGWSAPIGVPQFVGNDIGFTGDTLPLMKPPSGWEWVEADWAIDKSKSFGDTAEEGWVYGSSLERIQTMIDSLSTTGDKSTTWMFRKRRWCRTVRCVSKELVAEIELKINDLQKSRKLVEARIRDLQTHADDVSNFEIKRVALHSSAYSLAVQRITNTDQSVSELIEQLRKLRQFVLDLAVIERDFARRTSQLSAKYRVSAPAVSSTMVFGSLPSPDLREAASWDVNSPNKIRQRRTLSVDQFDAAFEGDRSDDEPDEDEKKTGVISPTLTLAVDNVVVPVEAVDEVPPAVSPVKEDHAHLDPNASGRRVSFHGVPSTTTSTIASPKTPVNSNDSSSDQGTIVANSSTNVSAGRLDSGVWKFFEAFCPANDIYASVVGNFSAALSSSTVQDIDALIKEAVELSKDTKLKLKAGCDTTRKLEEHSRMCASLVASTSSALVSEAVQTIGGLSTKLNSMRGGGRASELFAVSASIDGASSVSGQGNATNFGSETASAASASTSSSTGGSSTVSGSGSIPSGCKEDIWLSVQKYRRSVALTESCLQSFFGSAHLLNHRKMLLLKKERNVISTLIRTYSAHSSIGLSALCEKIGMLLVDERFTNIDGDTVRRRSIDTRNSINASSPSAFAYSEGSPGISDLPALPRLPTAAMAGRALLASSNAVRKFNEASVGRSPAPTSDDTADALGVFIVGGIRWVPVYAIVTQDGYLHLMKIDEQRSLFIPVPMKSIWIPGCLVEIASTASAELQQGVEVRPIDKPNTNLRDRIRHSMSGSADGVVLYTFAANSASTWLRAMLSPSQQASSVVPAADLELQDDLAIAVSSLTKADSDKICRSTDGNDDSLNALIADDAVLNVRQLLEGDVADASPTPLSTDENVSSVVQESVMQPSDRDPDNHVIEFEDQNRSNVEQQSDFIDVDFDSNNNESSLAATGLFPSVTSPSETDRYIGKSSGQSTSPANSSVVSRRRSSIKPLEEDENWHKTLSTKRSNPIEKYEKAVEEMHKREIGKVVETRGKTLKDFGITLEADGAVVTANQAVTKRAVETGYWRSSLRNSIGSKSGSPRSAEEATVTSETEH